MNDEQLRTLYGDALQKASPAAACVSTEQLLTLQQRLVDADYFSSVAVQPNVAAKAGTSMPIEALLIPAKRTVYKAGAYVSTDTGPGVRLGVDRRWLNDRGHKAGIKLDA